ncbi:hypothetical protein V3A08_07460 [Tenacibaculum maritimum]|uniref:hypothetical protein n=1 Tax=Tenacibaculum maritimum TaxID=107401 RepID=UPI0038764651
MNSALYVTYSYNDDFEIDISKLHDCKNGIYKLEVFVPKESVPLYNKDGSQQFIREDISPFELESSIPITNGILRFEFKEMKNSPGSNSKKIAVVRYLYCNE